MKNSWILVVLCSLFIGFKASATGGKDDNVIAESEKITYVLSEKYGAMESVKCVEETEYSASYADATVEASTYYNDFLKIDKASAPGAKKMYLPIDNGDIFYDGSRVCVLSMPLKKGTRGKVRFERTYRDVSQFCDLLLAGKYFTKISTVEIHVPRTLAGFIKVSPYKFTDSMTFRRVDKSDGGAVYIAETRDRKPMKKEDGAPDARMIAPQILITGHFSDLQNLYDYLHPFVPEEDEVSDELLALAADLRAKCADDRALVDSTATWVRRNIRYVGIEHGEYGMKPFPASEVLASRSGDCKGSANLIKTLLRRNGVDARVAWIGTRGRVPFTWDSVAAICSGNHMIAAAVFPDTILFRDGTTTNSAPGFIPPSIAGRQAMVENGDSLMLVTVPEMPEGTDYIRLFSKLRVDGDDLKGDVELSLGGVYGMSMLSLFDGLSPRQRQLATSRIISYPKNNSEISGATVTSSDTSQLTVLKASVSDLGAARRIGERIYLDLRPVRDRMLAYLDLTERVSDYELPFAYLSVFDYEVEIPRGYKVRGFPAALSVDDPWYKGCVEYSVSPDGRTLLCHAEITPVATYVPLQHLEARNQTVRRILRSSKLQLALIPE